MTLVRSKTLSLLSAVGVAVLILWLLLREGEDKGGEKERAEHRPAVAFPPGRSSPPDAVKPAQKPVPEWGAPEFSQSILERCAKWMESRGRDGASLVALWDLAGDENLLLEAAERFPDDPRVCAAMIGHLTVKGGDALPWAERLIQNEPKNPAGHYWKATLLAKAGKPEEALAILRVGTEVKGRPEQHLRERIITAREAVLAGGGSVKEAAFAALTGPFSKTGHPILVGEITATLWTGINEAKDAGDTDRVVELAGLGAAAAEHMRLVDARTMADEVISMALLQGALENLPPDTEYGSGEKTAGDHLTEFEAEREAMQELIRSSSGMTNEKFMKLTDSQAAEFTDRLILRGEAAAQRWLLDLTRDGGGNGN